MCFISYKSHNYSGAILYSNTIFNAWRQTTFKSTVVCRVSSASLNNGDSPIILNMHKLSAHDHTLRKRFYDEEYFDLQDLPAWTSISEVEYQNI